MKSFILHYQNHQPGPLPPQWPAAASGGGNKTTTMAAPCPLLGDGITDDTLIRIARFLRTTTDLLALGLTCPRFAAKIIAAAPTVGAGRAAAPESPMLSIVEEAARCWVAGCSEQERGWVPRRDLESWLGLMHEVEALRLPLWFGRAHASVTLSEGGAVATRSAYDGYYWTAVSMVVMLSGRHFAQFTLVQGEYLMFGVVRPGWDVEGGATAHTVDNGHCLQLLTTAYNGRRNPGHTGWEGSQLVMTPGDHIG